MSTSTRYRAQVAIVNATKGRRQAEALGLVLDILEPPRHTYLVEVSGHDTDAIVSLLDKWGFTPDDEVEIVSDALTDEQLCEAVAAALTADGFTAEGIYTGGNIWCIQIAEPTWRQAAWLVGNGCDAWGGCLENADGGVYEG